MNVFLTRFCRGKVDFRVTIEIKVDGNLNIYINEQIRFW